MSPFSIADHWAKVPLDTTGLLPTEADHRAAIASMNTLRSATPKRCATCGVMCVDGSLAHVVAEDRTASQNLSSDDFLARNADILGALRVSDAQWVGEDGGCVRRQCHVDPAGISTNDEGATVWASCALCASCFRRGEKPTLSYASGLDFGVRERLELPQLTVVERTLVQRVAHFTTLIKIRRTHHVAGTYRHHVISFPHDGGARARQILPVRGADISVVFVGLNSDAQRLSGYVSEICRVRAQVVTLWLHFLKRHNFAYLDVDVDESPATFAWLSQLGAEIVRDMHVEEEASTIVKDSLACDVDVVEDAATAQVDHEHVVVTQERPSAGPTELVAALRAKLRGTEEKPPAQVHVSRTPVCEFGEDVVFLLVGGFPDVFPVAGAHLKPLALTKDIFRRHILLSHPSAGVNGPLLFFFADVTRRKAVMHSVAVKVRQKKVDEVNKFLDDPNLATILGTPKRTRGRRKRKPSSER